MRLALVIKFLFGIFFLQIIGGGLCYFFIKYDYNNQLIGIAAFLDLLLLLWSAFWFASAAYAYNYDTVKALEKEHAKEREKIRVNAERQKVRLVNKNHKQILKETRRAHAVANFKTGAVLAGFLGLGGIMLYSQFMTVGLIVLTTGGGGLAGYLARVKQEKITQNREKNGVLPDLGSINSSPRKIS
ncbi:MAG: hypothetical protein D3923_04580 [Candidatus Electrothrix sp. AR3]|nr:hypothetical protein [Candidatus Electrothrix sp. AR3]